MNPSTLRSRRQSDEGFRTALEKAEAEAEAGFHGNILRTASGTPAAYERDEEGKLVLTDKGKPILLTKRVLPVWTASAWMLERRWPNRYAKREPVVEVNVTTDGDVSVGPIEGPPDGDWVTSLESALALAKSVSERPTKAAENGEPE